MLKLRCYLGQRMVFPQSTFRCYVSWGNRFQVDIWYLIFLDFIKLHSFFHDGLGQPSFQMPHFHQSEPWFSSDQISFKKRAPRAVRVVRQFAAKVMLTQEPSWGAKRTYWARKDCWLSYIYLHVFLHMKLFNMDHFISFEMFGNPYKQISLGQMVNRFWRMLKWLSICLFFNIWVSKHVNVFLLRGPRFNHQKYIIDLRGRAHRHQVEQVPLEQRCPQRPGALRTTSGWLVACNGCTSGASSCARALVPEAQRGQRKTCERPIVAGFDVSMSRNVWNSCGNYGKTSLYKLSNHQLVAAHPRLIPKVILW